MVDLPSMPRRLTTIGSPQSNLTARDIAGPFASVAKGLDDLGEGLGAVSEVLAERAGAEAVTRQEDGSIKIEQPVVPLVGNAAVAWSRAVKIGALAEGKTTTDRALADLRTETRDDPQAFMKAAEAFKRDKVAQFNQVGGKVLGTALGRHIDDVVTQTYRGLTNEKQARDLKTATSAIDSQIIGLSDDLEVMARARGTGHDEFKTRLGDLRTLLAEKVNNPLMAFPKEKADEILDQVTLRAQGAAVVEQTERVYRTGGYEAARKHLNENVASLGATMKNEQKIRAMGMAWLRSEDAGLRGERDGISREWAAAKGQADTLPAAVMDEMAGRAESVGAWRVASDIRTMKTALDVRREIRSLPLDEQTRIAATGQVGGSPQLADRIVRVESGGNPNAKNERSSATGPGQFVNDTWLEIVKRTRPDVAAGKSDEEILSLRRDPGLSREMVETYARENGARLKAAGVRFDDGALYLAHFLGPGDAIKVLSAPAGTPLAGLVDARSIKANQEVFAGNPTAAQLAAWADRKVGTTDLTQSRAGLVAMGMVKRDLSKDLQRRIDDFASADRKLSLPDAAEIAALGAEVHALGTPEQKQRVAELAAEAEIGEQFRQLPPPQRAEAIARWNARLQEGGSRFERGLRDKLTAADETITKAFKEDPYGAYYRFTPGAKALPAIDFTDPAGAAAVIDAKLTQQNIIRADQGGAAFSILRPAEATALGGYLSAAGPDQIGAAFQALGRLDNETLTATLSAPAVREAVTALARNTDPAKFTAGMSGLDRLHQRLGTTAFGKVFGDEAAHQLMTWQSSLRYMDEKQLTAERSRVLDPGQAAVRKKNEAEGRAEAQKQDPKQVTALFDESWAITPGPIARATGSQPLPPPDGLMRDTFMADYQDLYARRYADTLDKGQAAKQAVEMMKMKWQRSDVNGGRLMLRAPESVYPAVDGSHAWMKEQVESEIAGQIGPRERVAGTIFRTPSERRSATVTAAPKSWDYVLVADRQTEADALTGKPASYLVVTTDTGTQRQTVLPQRFAFDPSQAQEKARAAFTERRTGQFYTPNEPFGAP